MPFLEKEGYFCTELIGYLYQELNLLKKTNSHKAKSLLPVDFDGKNLEDLLIPTLSFEYVIIFESSVDG
jgi:hypothetical protein